jgi:hypothetical protein
VAVVNTADGEFKFKSFATPLVVFIISPMMGVDFQPSAEIEKGKNRITVKSTPQKAKKNNRLFKYLHLYFDVKLAVGVFCVQHFFSFLFHSFPFVSYRPLKEREKFLLFDIPYK